MKRKIDYTLTAKSPIILSPRGSAAFYKGIDFNDETKPNIIYPFCHYGEDNDGYRPKVFSYYIPGSSLKGALLSTESKDKSSENNRRDLMVDDIQIYNNQIDLLTLNRALHINFLFEKEERDSIGNLKGKHPKIDRNYLGQNTGVEAFKTAAFVSGSLYCSNDLSHSIQGTNQHAKQRLRLFVKQLTDIRSRTAQRNFEVAKNDQSKEDFLADIQSIIDAVFTLLEETRDDNLLFLGGYKGLLRSLTKGDTEQIFSRSAIYFDQSSSLPYGIMKIDIHE